MIRPLVGLLALAAAAGAMAIWGAKAEDRSGDTAPEAATTQAPAGLGEIMTVQQLRHIKLWFAGNADNWPLADYEIDELKEGFSDVDQLLGGGTVNKAVGAQLSALEKAVAGKNHGAFVTAFDNLSAGCNSCHRQLDHGFIVIGRPTSLPYSDQTFAPK